jgi:deoxyribonuclease-4
MDRLRFGPAGIPLSAKKSDIIEGLKVTHELNLDAFELEFVRGINFKKENIPKVKEIAKDFDIVLTAHAPYFINLNAKEEEKIKKSIERIIKTAELLDKLDGYSVIFHPGYYLKQDPKKVFENIKEKLKIIEKEVIDKGLKVDIRPELMGKRSSFGSLEEIVEICVGFEKIKPGIDFAHLHARTKAFNTKEEFVKVLELIEEKLGKEHLKDMHIHISGIEYDDKGEKQHLPLENSDLNWKNLIKVLKEYKVKGVVISESPLLEKDAIKMKDFYLKERFK